MIDIGFVHVKGHSGDKYNDKADELAKMGAIVLTNEDSPEGITNEEKNNFSKIKERKRAFRGWRGD